MKFDRKIDIDKDGTTDIEVEGRIGPKGIFVAIIPKEKWGRIALAIVAILGALGIGKMLGLM